MKQALTVFSPAKVNLQLEIGERRTDGFHQAKSIMQALTLHDMVTVVLDDGVDAYLNPDGFSDFAIDVTCTTFEGIPELDVAPEGNIAYKAAAALAEKLGHEQGQISIHIEKHIPFEAGLGGGSSNAAAVIAGLCRAWGEDAASEAALDVARAVGASGAAEDKVAANELLDVSATRLRKLNLPTRASYGIDVDEFRAQIPKMAKDAIDSGSPANTIKPLTAADLEAIYERLISA